MVLLRMMMNVRKMTWTMTSCLNILMMMHRSILHRLEFATDHSLYKTLNDVIQNKDYCIRLNHRLMCNALEISSSSKYFQRFQLPFLFSSVSIFNLKFPWNQAFWGIIFTRWFKSGWIIKITILIDSSCWNYMEKRYYLSLYDDRFKRYEHHWFLQPPMTQLKKKHGTFVGNVNIYLFSRHI